MKRRIVGLCIAVVALASVHAGRADEGIRIGPYSTQVTPNRAEIGARIEAGEKDRREARQPRDERVIRGAQRSSGPAVARGEPTMPISADSPLLKNPQPYGPESFWYDDGSGSRCIYFPTTSAICYSVT